MSMLLTLAVAFQATVGQVDERVLRLDLAYQDEDPALARIESYLEAMPARAYVVAPNDRLSDIIFDVFGVTQRSREGSVSGLPLLYDAILGSILRRSGMTDQDALHPGDTLWLPPLPRRALVFPNTERLENFQPIVVHVALRPRLAQPPQNCAAFPAAYEAVLAEHADTLADVVAPQFAEIQLQGSPATLECLDRVFRESSAPEIPNGLTLAGLTALVEPQRETEEERKTFSPWTLRADLRDRLVQALKAETATPIYLFVLDSGWPDIVSQNYSVAQLWKLLERLDRSYHLGLDLGAAPTVSDFYPPTNQHVREIQRALAPLDSVDTLDNVRVVYIPLTRDQGSEAFLRTLYTAYYRLDLRIALRKAAPEGSPDQPLPRQTQRRFDDNAKSAVRRLPETQSSGVIKSDVSLLNVVRFLATVDAQDNKRPFVLNLSWTVPQFGLASIDFGTSDGLTVVAAGNDAINLRRKPMDFAGRAAGDSRYLAVMNADSVGALRCSSSAFWVPGTRPAADASAYVYGVSFNGKVSGGACGTSFAAPRVAWLIAASEVPRRTAPLDVWKAGIAGDVVRMRQSGARPSPDFYFDPIRFLDLRGFR